MQREREADTARCAAFTQFQELQAQREQEIAKIEADFIERVHPPAWRHPDPMLHLVRASDHMLHFHALPAGDQKWEVKLKKMNGDEYSGFWEEGRPHGQGTYKYADGQEFT